MNIVFIVAAKLRHASVPLTWIIAEPIRLTTGSRAGIVDHRRLVYATTRENRKGSFAKTGRISIWRQVQRHLQFGAVLDAGAPAGVAEGPERPSRDEPPDAPPARSATPAGPRLPGLNSTGVVISHSAPALVAPRTRPSPSIWRTLRSKTSLSRTVALRDSAVRTETTQLRDPVGIEEAYGPTRRLKVLGGDAVAAPA